ncbi:class I adenylate-forming enzyme family protein [Salaquimonas pukyongi]|uniref:class I adenylate-forming enzyme family protein n=1 Tax=Salaquimonas pukyongi TaxID=2712698 RepID=UPI00096BA4BB|nr:AMP-binding protein [Salaquimonas pukyongi]
MNLAEWLVRSARNAPDAPALISGNEQIATYGEFAAKAAGFAGALRDCFNVAPGDRIAIFAANTVQYLVAMYGAWFAGAVIVPVNAKLHPREAGWIIEDSQAVLALITDKPGAALAGMLPESCGHLIDLQSPEFETLCAHTPLPAPVSRLQSDMAWLFYTSGTTGRPKGVMMTHGNIHAMAFAYFVDVDQVYETDAAFYAAPMSHGAGLYNVMHVLKAARHVVPASGGFDPAEIFEHGRATGSLHMFAAPTMIRRLVDHARASGETGEGIRTIVYGGGPMYLADIIEAVDVLGPRFVQIYGQGESPMCITALSREAVCDRDHPRWKERLASVGRAQSCVEVAIAAEDGALLPAGQSGEIIVRGAPVMAGYWNNEKATAETIRDGWLWTGDMGVLDEDGYLTLKDRSKDVIISGGTNIYPREVEEVLLVHPAVHEVSVIGVPDVEWGESVCAFVVLASGEKADAAALGRHCTEHIARFKRPKSYRFVDSLPKNNYGKVLKTELRKIAEQTGENP